MIELTELLKLLNQNYLNQFDTKIIGGFDEPFYKAHTEQQPAQIQFSHDYIRSALHELAHWCVAGNQRRKRDDYGYWYAADGRNQQQQNEFFKVEIKPQAIEWSFSIVLGIHFESSVDNLGAQVQGIDEFNDKLKKQLSEYTKKGFPKRTHEILSLLSNQQGIGNFMIEIKKKLSLSSYTKT